MDGCNAYVYVMCMRKKGQQGVATIDFRWNPTRIHQSVSEIISVWENLTAMPGTHPSFHPGRSWIEFRWAENNFYRTRTHCICTANNRSKRNSSWTVHCSLFLTILRFSLAPHVIHEERSIKFYAERVGFKDTSIVDIKKISAHGHEHLNIPS